MLKIPKSREGIMIASLIKEIYYKLNNNIGYEFKNTGLTIPQLTVLRILAKHKKLKVTDVSDLMNLTKGTVSGIIDRLEKQNLVVRTRSSEDRRVVYIELSEKGSNITESMRGTINEYFNTLFSKCSEEEISTIIEGLEILKSVVDNIGSQTLEH